MTQFPKECHCGARYSAVAYFQLPWPGEGLNDTAPGSHHTTELRMRQCLCENTLTIETCTSCSSSEIDPETGRCLELFPPGMRCDEMVKCARCTTLIRVRDGVVDLDDDTVKCHPCWAWSKAQRDEDDFDRNACPSCNGNCSRACG